MAVFGFSNQLPGGQAEGVRVPFADATLFHIPESRSYEDRWEGGLQIHAWGGDETKPDFWVGNIDDEGDWDHGRGGDSGPRLPRARS